MLGQLMSHPQHAQQALQLLHLLVQNSSVCQVLHAGLEEELQPESGAATVPSQAVRHSEAQAQASGHSASSPMDIDADHDNDSDSDHPIRYFHESLCEEDLPLWQGLCRQAFACYATKHVMQHFLPRFLGIWPCRNASRHASITGLPGACACKLLLLLQMDWHIRTVEQPPSCSSDTYHPCSPAPGPS